MCAALDALREWKTRIFHIAQMESTRNSVRKLVDIYDCPQEENCENGTVLYCIDQT